MSKMVSARSPPWKKQTPSNYPKLLDAWKTLYNDLISIYPKSRALEVIGQRHGGISRTTVTKFLFPGFKNVQKKQRSRKWHYEKKDPVIHKKRIDYKRRYVRARRHIGDLIRKSYRMAAPKDQMTLEELSYALHEASGIFFKPDTIAGLLNRLESHKGYPLLEEVSGSEPVKYRISNQRSC